MGDSDLQELLEQLRATVAERRASGEYPDGLEADLDAHFQRIIASRPGVPRLALLRRRVDTARRASRFSPARIPMTSKLPGGQQLHRGLAKLFFRQAQGILLQVQEFADRTIEALDAAVGVLESPDNHRHDDLVEVVDGHSEILARRERAPAMPLERLDDVVARVEALEAARAARQWRPWFSRARFEAAFGDGGRSRAEARAAGALGPAGLVIDLTNGDGDPVSALASEPPAAAEGIVLVGADERISAAGLVELIGLAGERLTRGGRLVVTCGAPPDESSEDTAGGTAARFDPSLGSPLPADYAAFACREAGFGAVDVERWPASGYLLVATR